MSLIGPPSPARPARSSFKGPRPNRSIAPGRNSSGARPIDLALNLEDRDCVGPHGAPVAARPRRGGHRVTGFPSVSDPGFGAPECLLSAETGPLSEPAQVPALDP